MRKNDPKKKGQHAVMFYVPDDYWNEFFAALESINRDREERLEPKRSITQQIISLMREFARKEQRRTAAS